MAALTWDKVSANNRSSLNAGMTIEIFNTGGDYGSERDRKQSIVSGFGARARIHCAKRDKSGMGAQPRWYQQM